MAEEPAVRGQQRCRACAEPTVDMAADFGAVPQIDELPDLHTDAGDDPRVRLVLAMCRSCSLVQLLGGDDTPPERSSLEPLALREQAKDALSLISGLGLLPEGTTVREFASPHGGSWIPHLPPTATPLTTGSAELVIDIYGVMHDPHQREAFTERVRALSPTGVLVLQYHSAETILKRRQWHMIRPGHYAYYTLASLQNILGKAGLTIWFAREYPIYGGSVLIIAAPQRPPSMGTDTLKSVRELADREQHSGALEPVIVKNLEQAITDTITLLRETFIARSRNGKQFAIYAASSRLLMALARTGLTCRDIAVIVDADPGKHGRRAPGTDIPIIAPDQLRIAETGEIYVSIPELLPEVAELYSSLSVSVLPLDAS